MAFESEAAQSSASQTQQPTEPAESAAASAAPTSPAAPEAEARRDHHAVPCLFGQLFNSLTMPMFEQRTQEAEQTGAPPPPPEARVWIKP